MKLTDEQQANRIRKIELYRGKARGMTKEEITKAWLKYTRPLERLETGDFNDAKN